MIKIIHKSQNEIAVQTLKLLINIVEVFIHRYLYRIPLFRNSEDFFPFIAELPLFTLIYCLPEN